nr:unnamed protein product [Meloidogyne enterolobii]
MIGLFIAPFAIVVALFAIGYIGFVYLFTQSQNRKLAALAASENNLIAGISASENRLIAGIAASENRQMAALNQILFELRGRARPNGNAYSLQGFFKSPIDICRGDTAYNGILPNARLIVNYGGFTALMENIQNVGLSVRWTNPSVTNFPYIICNDKKFRLQQLFINWGNGKEDGSLHKIGGKGFAGELNFLHRNVLFGDMSDALRSPDGALFIAVFLIEAKQDNENLTPLIDALYHVKYAGTEFLLPQFDASQLLPIRDKRFWLYSGSEIVAPYRETVNWLVCYSKIPISSKQLARLRELRKGPRGDVSNAPLMYPRPLHLLNNRTIQSSFVWPDE